MDLGIADNKIKNAFCSFNILCQNQALNTHNFTRKKFSWPPECTRIEHTLRGHYFCKLRMAAHSSIAVLSGNIKRVAK